MNTSLSSDKLCKTTKAEYDLFVAECLKWIEVFGLREWTIGFRHGGIDAEKYAEIEWDTPNMIATIYFNDVTPASSAMRFTR